MTQKIEKNQEKKNSSDSAMTKEDIEMERYDLLEYLHDFAYQNYLENYYVEHFPYEMDLSNPIVNEAMLMYSWTGKDWWDEKEEDKELDRIAKKCLKLKISEKEFDEAIDSASKDAKKFLSKVKK